MGNSKSSSQELDEQSVSTDPSYWEMAKQGYQDLVNAIIRPPRCQYSIINLGPPEFFFCGKQFRRCDFEITNYRGLKVQCSMWEPISRPNDILPCVIYMHGNSSARVEGISQLSLVLSLGATMLAFDFSGSGMSEGEFVSLGYFERDDLQCVVEHLRRTGTTSTIALWGRSMGAATALLHGERDPSIAGMVLDSAFASLLILSEEMVDKGRQQGLIVPQFVTKIAIRWIRSSVLQKAAFDILELNPIERADRCYIPALFVAAENDNFIPPHHSKQIHDKYAGDKNMVMVRGDHNSMRPSFLYDSVGIFLSQTLQIPEHWSLDRSLANGVLPWSGKNYYSAQSNSLDELSVEQVVALMSEDGKNNDEYILENIGMTDERQADITSAMYAMLGSQRSATLNDESQPSDGDKLHVIKEWSCENCTLLNVPSAKYCNACGIPKI